MGRELCSNSPRQQLSYPIYGMVRDPLEHVTQIGFRVDVVQLGVNAKVKVTHP